MTTSLSTLITQQTQQQIFQIMLGVAQSYGLPTTAWQPLGTERTRWMAFSAAVTQVIAQWIPVIAAGGFVDYASGAWLQLLAKEEFGIDYNQATATIGSITLTSSASAPAYTVAAGQLTAVFGASGNRYVNTAGGTLTTGGTLNLTFQAESPGAKYNDASNSSITLVNPLPGVTLSNPAGNYSTVAHVGSGTGTLSLSGTPVGAHQIVVRIDATLTSAPATASYSLDGAPYVSVGSVSSFVVPGTGIAVTFSNGVSGTSWVLNDTYLFSIPGSWITTQGSDTESDASLRARCVARWSSLSPVPVSNFYYLLATSTPTVGSQITQVIVLPDSVIPGQVNVIVAGPGGAVPGATVAAVQTYVTARVPTTEKAVVSTPSTTNVTLAGAITCQAALLSSVQGAVQTAMTNYIASVGINGTIRVSAIIELIMQITGVVDVSGVTINGSASNLTLGSSTTFVLPSLQPLSFTYPTV